MQGKKRLQPVSPKATNLSTARSKNSNNQNQNQNQDQNQSPDNPLLAHCESIETLFNDNKQFNKEIAMKGANHGGVEVNHRQHGRTLQNRYSQTPNRKVKDQAGN